MKILLGDANAKVGRENILKPTIGNDSLHHFSNDNGVTIVNFTASKNLVVKSSCTGTFINTPGPLPMFLHWDIHKYTWTSPNVPALGHS
jgi:hypothetical protein